MDLVTTILGNNKLDKDSLLAYGFSNEFKVLTYTKTLIDSLELRLSYDDCLNIVVWDLELDEEYLGYKYQGKGAYGSLVESEIEKVLIDIKDKCLGGIFFKFEQTSRMDEYMSAVYGKCDHPFSDSPEICAYKESSNAKWYALVMSVSFNKLDKDKTNEKVEIINLKADKKEINNLTKTKGIYPAYHMNKANWISVVLDDSLSDVDLILLINNSYDLVQSSINNKKFYRRKK